jgi:hypothetical protein
MQLEGLAFQGLSKLDEGISQIMPQPLCDMEMIELLIGLRPDFRDHFGERGQEIEHHTIGFDSPSIELSAEGFPNSPTVELWHRFEVEDANPFGIPGDLLITAPPPGHEFIQAKGSGEA